MSSASHAEKSDSGNRGTPDDRWEPRDARRRRQLIEATIASREKRQRERESRQQNRDFTKYDVGIAGETYTRQPKRWAIFRIVKHLCDEGIKPDEISETARWRKDRMFRSVGGEVDSDRFIAILIEEQQRGVKNSDPGRYFCSDEELIIEDGRTYAFTKMWGNRTAEAMQMLVNKYPQYKIEVAPT